MTPKETKRVIVETSSIVFNWSRHSIESSDLYDRAYEAALSGEKQHRKGFRWTNPKYRNSVDIAARYFVVKWFVDPAVASDVRAAAALRYDCLCASALRAAVGECLQRAGKPPVADSAEWTTLRRILEIDYSTDIANN